MHGLSPDGIVPIAQLAFDPTQAGWARWLSPGRAQILALIYDARMPLTVKRIATLVARMPRLQTHRGDGPRHMNTIIAQLTTLRALGLIVRLGHPGAYRYAPALPAALLEEHLVAQVLGAIGRDVVARWLASQP